MRVLRIGNMITKTNFDESTKAILNLAKIIFYLFFYLHTIASLFWIVLGFNSGTRYYRNIDTGNYMDYNENVLLDANGNEVPYDD